MISHHERMPPQLPPLFDDEPQSIMQGAKDVVASIQAVWDKVVGEVTPENATIENVILPIAHNENTTKLHIDIIIFLSTVHPAAEVREATKDARRFIDEAEVDLYLREDMFRLVNALLQKTDEAATDPEKYRFLLKFHAQFLRNGCDLEGQARAQFEWDTKRLNMLTKEYKSNLDNNKAGMWVTRSDLEGLPADFINSLKEGDAENQDMLWVSMTRPHWSRVLKFARSEDMRKRYFIQHLNRVPENVPLHREIILLRDSLARQKAWNSWADLKMSEKMIQNPAEASKILAEMHVKLYEKGAREAEELLALKRADVPGPETRLFFWDHSFYENARDEKDSIDSRLTMDYFEVRTTVRNILSLYERLFDIEFELLTAERAEQLRGKRYTDTTWQEDVFFYIVWDKTNEDPFLGYLYFDLHPRPGKYTHAGHFNLQKGFINEDGTRSYPSGALVLNYAKPTGSKPSLLNIGEVRSLFHEVGHGMHNILSVTKFARFHGPKVDRDFVETPSIFFEYFLWTPQHIREVSCHYSHTSPQYEQVWRSKHPDEQSLPSKHFTDDLVHSTLSTPESCLTMLRQFHFATYDLAVHNPASRQELEELNLTELFNQLWAKMVPSNGGEALGLGWEWAHGQSALRLIMGDSYDAGQYAYILGRMWAVDIFETFFAADTMNKEAGRLYRDMLLRPGGSQPEWKTLTDYLGRSPKPDAFYRRFGVS